MAVTFAESHGLPSTVSARGNDVDQMGGARMCTAAPLGAGNRAKEA